MSILYCVFYILTCLYSLFNYVNVFDVYIQYVQFFKIYIFTVYQNLFKSEIIRDTYLSNIWK